MSVFCLFNYGIPFLNYIQETCKYFHIRFLFYYDSYQIGVKSDTIYFFDQNPTPYIDSFIDIHNNNNAVVLWKYSRSMKKFFQYSCEYKDVKHFPMISASITLDGETKFVLDEFFSDIVVERTNADFPSLQQMLEIWSYTEGIVLDRHKPYKFLYTDSHLNEYTVNLFSGSFVFP